MPAYIFAPETFQIQRRNANHSTKRLQQDSCSSNPDSNIRHPKYETGVPTFVSYRYLLTDLGWSGAEICRSYELRVIHVVKFCIFQSVVSLAPLTDNRYYANVCAPLRFHFSISHMVQNCLYCVGLKWNFCLRSFHISVTLQSLQFHIC